LHHNLESVVSDVSLSGVVWFGLVLCGDLSEHIWSSLEVSIELDLDPFLVDHCLSGLNEGAVRELVNTIFNDHVRD